MISWIIPQQLIQFNRCLLLHLGQDDTLYYGPVYNKLMGAEEVVSLGIRIGQLTGYSTFYQGQNKEEGEVILGCYHAPFCFQLARGT